MATITECLDVPTARRAPASRHTDANRNTEYEHLTPLLNALATLDPNDPRRLTLRDEVITGYHPLALHIARRFANRGEPYDDLVQVATLGLIHAVDRFDPTQGSSFLSFAIPTIQGEIRRYFRDRTWSMRVPRKLKDVQLAIQTAVAELSQSTQRAPRPSEIAERIGVSVDEVLAGLEAAQAYRSDSLDEALSKRDSHGDTLGDTLGEVDPRLGLVEDFHALQPLLAELPERERTILMLRFHGNMTQTQIAEQIGVSQMHVSRLLAQTLTHLREQLQAE